MDDLDLLRSDWKKKEREFVRIPRDELYAMLHRKSASVVKWILALSIIEMIFWVSLSLMSSDVEDSGTRLMDSLDIDPILYAISMISYGILIVFCILIYRAYRRIKITDNAKNLMRSILNVRKTVSHYIYINIGFMIISLMFIFFEYFNKDAKMIALFDKAEADGKFYLMAFMAILVVLVALGILTTIAWLLYRIVYGFLLRKLRRNYEELKKIEG